MPHIQDKGHRRAYLLNNPANVMRDEDLTIAELEFIFSQYVVWYVQHNGLSFKTLKDIDGLFSTAQSEFYRLVTAPYEDIKIKENGNAYEELTEVIKKLKKE